MAKVAEVLRPDAPVEKPGFEDAKRVLSVIDCGLSNGLGTPEPGQMCVEAAVCYALGFDHGDDPKCVDSDLANFKIVLNDNGGWYDEESRASGLRRLAIAQLGTDKKFSYDKFFSAFRTSVIERFAKPYIQSSIEDALESVQQDLEGLLKSLNAWTKNENEFVDVHGIELDLDTVSLEEVISSFNDAESMFGEITSLSDLRSNDVLAILAEMAIEAIEKTHPKLESLTWMNKLTKKPAAPKVKKKKK